MTNAALRERLLALKERGDVSQEDIDIIDAVSKSPEIRKAVAEKVTAVEAKRELGFRRVPLTDAQSVDKQGREKVVWQIKGATPAESATMQIYVPESYTPENVRAFFDQAYNDYAAA